MLTAPPFHANTWRDLYVAALLEGDRDRVPNLITAAERAIAERARELFKVSGDHIEEEQAMDDALYALHALKSCIGARSSYVEAA
jgi:hypothetical protein